MLKSAMSCNLLNPMFFLGFHFIYASSCFYLKCFFFLTSLTPHLPSVLINMLPTNIPVSFSFSDLSVWECLDLGSSLPIISLTPFPNLPLFLERRNISWSDVAICRQQFFSSKLFEYCFILWDKIDFIRWDK